MLEGSGTFPITKALSLHRTLERIVVGRRQQMPRKRERLTQEQLDRIIRKAAGNNAIEVLISANAAVQKYLLSDGSMLSVRAATGKTRRKG
jgi:hypothetical protein